MFVAGLICITNVITLLKSIARVGNFISNATESLLNFSPQNSSFYRGKYATMHGIMIIVKVT